MYRVSREIPNSAGKVLALRLVLIFLIIFCFLRKHPLRPGTQYLFKWKIDLFICSIMSDLNKISEEKNHSGSYPLKIISAPIV